MRYWEERAKEWEKARDKKEHKLNAALVTAYKNAADDLQKEITAWYAKYAGEAGISLSDAKKRLDGRERRQLTRSVKAFEKLAKQNKDHSQDEILTKMSAAVHINRLTSMQFQMRYILYELYSDVNNELADGLKSFYADEHEQMAYEAQMARGKFEPVAMIDEKRISAVLKTPWATDGKDFSARLWNNREQLIGALQSELTRALITGADSASVAKTIAQKMNAAQYAASRLVSTEITRIITASDIDTFAEMGIDEVEIVGTLDLHTCDTCGDMDGNHMPRTEAKAGTTAPPFHPNCRCVIVPYFGDDDDTRATRNPETGKTETAPAMTFKEWKEKYTTDYMGKPQRFKDENVSLKAYELDGHKGFFVQRNTENALKTAEIIEKAKEKIPELESVKEIVIGEDIPGIAAYNHQNNRLYVNAGLSNSAYMKKALGEGYFAATNVKDVLYHEMTHKKHHEYIEKMAKTKGEKYDTMKQEIEAPLREYISWQRTSDTLYLVKVVSVYADGRYDETKQVNEVIAEVLTLEEKGIIRDEMLLKHAKECIGNDDGMST